MPSEAKIKLSVDTSQAQQQIKLIDQQLNDMSASGIKIDTSGESAIGSSDKSRGISDNLERLINAQEKFLNNFADYMKDSEKSAQDLSNKLDKLNDSLKNGGGGTGVTGGSKTIGGSGDNGSSGMSELKSLLGGLATGATVASAVNSLISYMKSGANSSENSSLEAYNTLNRTGLYYGAYSTGRNVQAEVGSSYGYDVYNTLAAQQTLLGKTGANVTQEELTADTSSALQAARAMSVDENSLLSTYGSYYQTGTYSNGDMNRFANLFATAVEEAGMTGREDEQLEILESINKLLDENLTYVTENQYETALGLYSMFSSSNQAMSGSTSSSMVESLNNAITNGSNSMDIALGRYSGQYSSLWEFEQQKEKGVTDTQNLSSIISYFEDTLGMDLNTDVGKYSLYSFLNTNGANLTTEEVEAIINNRESIKNGSYANAFSESVANETGTNYIEDLYSGYNADKISTELQYNAETENSQERIGDTTNELTKGFKSLYNNLPQWMQTTGSGLGSLLGGAAKMGGTILTSYVGGKAISGGASALKNIFGGAASTATGATSAAGTAAGAAGNVAKSAASVMDTAIGATASSADDVVKAVAGSADDVVKVAAGSADDVIKAASGAASTASKVAKGAAAAAAVVEGVTTGIEVYGDIKNEDYREAASDTGGGVGSIAGGLAGGYGGATGGASLGAMIGTLIAPGPGTAVGAALGGLIGGIGGSIGGSAVGNKVGETVGEGVYDLATGGDQYTFTDDQIEQIQEYYDEVKRLYEEQGNNAAQKYTKETVVPYLSSLGVSESVTKKYNWDVGNPDFLKDIEKGVYGDYFNTSKSTSDEQIESVISSMDDSYDAIEANTEAIENLTSALYGTSAVAGNGISGVSAAAFSGTSLAEDNYDTTTNSTEVTTSTGLVSRIKGWLGIGSNAVGNDYIPYDGYLSELHKGETVLDAHTAEEYRQGKLNETGSAYSLEIKLSGGIEGMTAENQNQIVAEVIRQLNIQASITNSMNSLAYNTVRVAN